MNHVHEDGADRRHEGDGRSRQTQPGDPAARLNRFLHPGNTLFERLADRRAVHPGRFFKH